MLTTEIKATVDRSTSGLREVLFAEIDALRAGTIDPARAHATAKLAQQILTSVSLELTAVRFLEANKETGRSLPKLKLVG